MTQDFIDDTVAGKAGACPDGSGVEAPIKAIRTVTELLTKAEAATGK